MSPWSGSPEGAACGVPRVRLSALKALRKLLQSSLAAPADSAIADSARADSAWPAAGKGGPLAGAPGAVYRRRYRGRRAGWPAAASAGARLLTSLSDQTKGTEYLPVL